MDKIIRGKCVHATATVIHEYPEHQLAQLQCTWNCCRIIWKITDGVAAREITEQEARRILEVKVG